MLKARRHFISGLFLSLSILFAGISTPVMAHDGTIGSDSSPEVFYNDTPMSYLHEDNSPWKGFFMYWTQNSTGVAWTGIDFTVSGSNAIFIDTALYDSANSDTCADWAFDGDCDPRSSKGIDSWTISGNQKSMSVTLSNTWDAGQTGWVRVYTDNTASPQGDFTVSVSPVLVPEPISSSLFIVGAATLGFRRFRKK